MLFPYIIPSLFWIGNTTQTKGMGRINSRQSNQIPIPVIIALGTLDKAVATMLDNYR